jgi:hypothetical protein
MRERGLIFTVTRGRAPRGSRKLGGSAWPDDADGRLQRRRDRACRLPRRDDSVTWSRHLALECHRLVRSFRQASHVDREASTVECQPEDVPMLNRVLRGIVKMVGVSEEAIVIPMELGHLSYRNGTL